MRNAALVAILLTGVVFLFGQPSAQKKRSSSKSGSKSVSSKSTARKKTASGRKSSAHKTSWRNTQRTPTPERYKEIQQALASKGYLRPGVSNGVWDSSSVEALKRFQEDQNLEASGKIDSLSLIALGLGPRRDPQPAPRP